MLLFLLSLFPVLLPPSHLAHAQAVYDSGFRSPDSGLLMGLCPDYTRYALIRHQPFSDGPLQLPFQRPVPECRRFVSPEVEKVIDDLYPRFVDRDLAQIFQNAFPNTLDTTVLWHVDGSTTQAKTKMLRDQGRWQGAQSFIVTGDINAEWLRDSTNQLAQYQLLAKSAPDISNLILGAINTQAEFVNTSPYCNAFQPPAPSGLQPVHSGQDDLVHPNYEPSVVFECKYELDSLANFLALANRYYNATGNTAFLTDTWFMALETLLQTISAQSSPTFNPTSHAYAGNQYTFQRNTNVGTETLSLMGIGNPLANGTGLIRSAFRPSDDATIFGFFIPANAMMSVELGRTAVMLRERAKSIPDQSTANSYASLATNLESRSAVIKQGIYDNAIVNHPKFGKVFAFETDGYGSHVLMDDANIPSLLSLPQLGFLENNDEIYQNTRKMVLSPEGNPYFLTGASFRGIGGPHVGLKNAWPMSVLMQAMTSDDPVEILDCLDRVKNVSIFGLINESVNVVSGPGWSGDGMTRSWFAWANSVYAQTILWLAETKPELLFGAGAEKYIIGKGFH